MMPCRFAELSRGHGQKHAVTGPRGRQRARAAKIRRYSVHVAAVAGDGKKMMHPLTAPGRRGGASGRGTVLILSGRRRCCCPVSAPASGQGLTDGWQDAVACCCRAPENTVVTTRFAESGAGPGVLAVEKISFPGETSQRAVFSSKS